MIDETIPEIIDDMSDEEETYLETRSRRQSEYTVPGYHDPEVLDGVLHRDQNSLIYSYVTEYQIDIDDIENLNL